MHSAKTKLAEHLGSVALNGKVWQFTEGLMRAEAKR
jgi:hypothetical protein